LRRQRLEATLLICPLPGQKNWMKLKFCQKITAEISKRNYRQGKQIVAENSFTQKILPGNGQIKSVASKR